MNLKKVLSVLAVTATISAPVVGSAWAATPTVDATARATTAAHAVIGEKTGLVFNESSFKVVKKSFATRRRNSPPSSSGGHRSLYRSQRTNERVH